MITIKKISQETIYKRENFQHVFEVNGKKVRVLEYTTPVSEDFSESDFEVIINEDDLKALTDLEHEAFGEDQDVWLGLKVGEETKVEEMEEDNKTCKGCGKTLYNGQSISGDRHSTCL